MKEFIRFILILIVNISVGRRFSRESDSHTIKLPKSVRRWLYIVDLDCSRVSIAGLIWQITIIVTAIGLCIAWLIFRFDFFFWYNGISVCEWVGIGLPLGVYLGVCELLIKK